jgi:hypothetical protein
VLAGGPILENGGWGSGGGSAALGFEGGTPPSYYAHGKLPRSNAVSLAERIEK